MSKEIEIQSLGFAEGVAYGMSQPKRKVGRQIDWERLKKIIETEKGLTFVSAGLAEDWEYTGDVVWTKERGYEREYVTVYAASQWATPAVILDYEDGSEKTIECWIEGDDPHSYFTFDD